MGKCSNCGCWVRIKYGLFWNILGIVDRCLKCNNKWKE